MGEGEAGSGAGSKADFRPCWCKAKYLIHSPGSWPSRAGFTPSSVLSHFVEGIYLSNKTAQTISN